MKYLVFFFISIIAFNNRIYSQELSTNCNIDTITFNKINIIPINANLRTLLENKENYRFITNTNEIESIMINDSSNIDYSKYNLFIGKFDIGGCQDPKNKYLSLFNTKNNEKDLMITIIQIGLCKVNRRPVFISFLVLKTDCTYINKVCYTKIIH